MISLHYLSSEIYTHYTLLLTISSLSLYYVHRDGDIEMSDNTAYDTTHHTHTDESPYEDVNKLWVGMYNYTNAAAAY